MIPALAFAAAIALTPQAWVDGYVRDKCDVPGYTLNDYTVHDPLAWGATVIVTMSGDGDEGAGWFPWVGYLRVTLPPPPINPPYNLQVNGP